MRRFDVRAIGGILLIAVGILLLLQNIGVFEVVVALVWAVIFAAGGLVFLYMFLTNRAQSWWAIIPGLALLSIAVLIALDEFSPQVGEVLGGALFLGGLGLAFWVIYFIKREHWWAIIPGGVMFTLALVTVLSYVLGGDWAGGAFFVGLGLTFGLLHFLPTPLSRMKWPLIPAAVLVVMGVLITVAAAGGIAYLEGAVLILVGLYLLFRLFVKGE